MADMPVPFSRRGTLGKAMDAVTNWNTAAQSVGCQITQVNLMLDAPEGQVRPQVVIMWDAGLGEFVVQT